MNKEIKYSSEEKLMLKKLTLLKDKGYIKEIVFQPDNFLLFEGLKKVIYSINEKNGKKKLSKKGYLLNPHSYTTDYKIVWNNNAKDKYFQDINNEEINFDIPFIANLIKNEYISFIEIKGTFDRYNTIRMAKTYIIPIIWEKYKIYIQIIIPKLLNL